MRLIITTPTEIAVNIDNVHHVRAEDSTGSFGVLPGHADFLTALTISVLNWRDDAGSEHCAAVRGGVLRVRGGKSVQVATREAVVGNDLQHLREVVLKQMARNAESEQAARLGAFGLQEAAVQKIYRYLRPSERPASLLGHKS
jgi:F-type H+-transporting ATPase subunit epsilon